MTTNNHPAHGPVSLDRLHQISEILSKAAVQSDVGNLGCAMSDAVKVIDGAIAAFGTEPVAYMTYKGYLLHAADPKLAEYSDPTPLYTAPPAPVSVPAAMEMDDDFDSAFEHGKAVGWNAYRAAMLQGAEPVTTDYKLPFDQWLSQQTGTIDVECGCVMTEVFFHWLRVAYEAGNSSQCREISNSSTNNFRENAETSTKCWCRTCRPVTFADSHFVVCPECGNKRCPHANDHRNACTGSNEPGQEGSAYPA
ncbi:hypothetical protein, partial [Citrobacter freundii]|uniref:hypothetical protein n=1 Tax=Citrobacter freundii TaxID=546 RepID=UPI001F26E5C0